MPQSVCPLPCTTSFSRVVTPLAVCAVQVLSLLLLVKKVVLSVKA